MTTANTAIPPIRLLRPGTYTDIAGQTVSFGTAELAAMIASYDFASDPSPLVIGHPSSDDPAWGWVEGLAMDGDTLVAKPVDVVPAFAELVRARQYRKVSASFYPPTHPSNPKPGAWYLKHVGFLGAEAPAVKGLGSVSLSDAATMTTIDLAEARPAAEPSDDANPEPEPNEELSMPTAEELAARQAALDAREAELNNQAVSLSEREAAATAAATAARQADNVAFVEGQIAAAKLAPAAKDRVIALMGQLDAVVTISFGESGEMTPVAMFRSLFDGAHPVIALGEHAPAAKPGPDKLPPKVIADKAVAFQESEQAAGRTVTVQEAVRKVTAELAA